MKVAIIGYKFCYGGLEKVMSNVSVLLENDIDELVTIVLDNDICYKNGGQLINLGKESKINKYLKLNKILKKHQFDYVLDFRYRLNPWMELLFIFYFYRRTKVIYTVHSSNIEAYFTKINWVAKLILSRVYKVVSVSEGITELLEKKYEITNLKTIYNFIDIKNNSFDLEEIIPYEYIIAVGRLDEIKQFDRLIEAYFNSVLISKNIHLVILGDGTEKEKLINLVNNLGIGDYVHLKGFIKNPYPYIKNAKFLTLSSQYEGFGMVLLEALFCGTPVISFDCKVGPNEIIQNNKNGILVTNQDFNELTLAIEKLYLDKELHSNCKEFAKESVEKFSKDTIKKDWLSLLKIK